MLNDSFKLNMIFLIELFLLLNIPNQSLEYLHNLIIITALLKLPRIYPNWDNNPDLGRSKNIFCILTAGLIIS